VSKEKGPPPRLRGRALGFIQALGLRLSGRRLEIGGP